MSRKEKDYQPTQEDKARHWQAACEYAYYCGAAGLTKAFHDWELQDEYERGKAKFNNTEIDHGQGVI